MAFYEVSLGFVGLGSTDVLRTAAQAAADIEKYGAETADARATGGLFDAEMVFRHSAARGRLDDLDNAVKESEKMLTNIQLKIGQKLEEMQRLGAPNVGAMAAKFGTMAVGYFLPVLGFALQFAGIGGMSKAKKRRIGELERELDQLKVEYDHWVERNKQLNAEGETLSRKMQEKGTTNLSVGLVAIPKKEEVKRVFDMARGKVVAIDYTRKIVDVKDQYLATEQTLQARKDVMPSGARLPEGFQQLYSPALKDKTIVVKSAAPKAGGPELVTGQKLVFGGLAGIGEPLPQSAMPMLLAMVGGLWFLSLLVQESKQPLRVRYVAHPRRRLA
jgi:Skp family chaperone for outer membrane proteins